MPFPALQRPGRAGNYLYNLVILVWGWWELVQSKTHQKKHGVFFAPAGSIPTSCALGSHTETCASITQEAPGRRIEKGRGEDFFFRMTVPTLHVC